MYGSGINFFAGFQILTKYFNILNRHFTVAMYLPYTLCTVIGWPMSATRYLAALLGQKALCKEVLGYQAP